MNFDSFKNYDNVYNFEPFNKTLKDFDDELP